MTIVSPEQLEVVKAAIAAHLAARPLIGVPPTAQPAAPDPEEEQRLDHQYANREWDFLLDAITRNEAFHTRYLRGGASVESIIGGASGPYAAEVMTSLINRLQAQPVYINTAEGMDHFIRVVESKAQEDLEQYDLTPAQLHDTDALTEAQLSDAFLMREPNSFDSDERAAEAHETMKSEMARVTGRSVDELEAQQASDWAHQGTTVIDGRIFADDVEDLPGVEFGEDPWGLGVEEVARTLEANWDAWDAEQKALEELNGDPINALAPVAPDQEMIDAMQADRAAKGCSEFPPEMRQSREAEQAGWASLLKGTD